MPKLLFIALGLVIVFSTFATLVRASLKKTPKALNLKARRPLSPFEEKMFFALRDALPDNIILAQVSFSALVTSRRDQRNYYDRKFADFVICDKSLTPVAIIELDDSSHKTKADKDAKRDAMLATAGYRTIRYTAIPLAAKIQADVLPTPPQNQNAA